MPTGATYVRHISRQLTCRLAEAPRLLQILAGPRQVGKTTLVGQLMDQRPIHSFWSIAADPQALPAVASGLDPLAAAPQALPPSPQWLQSQWQLASQRALTWDQTERLRLTQAGIAEQPRPFVLVVDEIQKVPQWSSLVKGLWDANRQAAVPMHVVLLGSAPLLMQQGLTESLAGRYELTRMTQWSFDEMNEAFGLSLDEYIYFGGYPGAAPFIGDEPRWRSYIRDAIIEPSIERDVLAMTRVDKPALLRQLFEIGCQYSGQILSLDKVAGLLGKGHVQTLADNLTRLSQAGLLSGLHKYAGQVVRQRASAPKFQVHDNALMSALSSHDYAQARSDRSHWGRLVESSVGAHLMNSADRDTRLYYWREADKEVDFVINRRSQLAAVEVKTSTHHTMHAGLTEFCKRHPSTQPVLVGSPQRPVGDFLLEAAIAWLQSPATPGSGDDISHA